MLTMNLSKKKEEDTWWGYAGDGMYKTSVRFLGTLGTKYFSNYFVTLKEEITKSNLAILYEMYIGRMLFFSISSFLASVIGITIVFMYLIRIPFIFAFISGLIGAATTSVIVLFLSYSYPFHQLTTKKTSIESNMPFAISHMSAIASSGVPPFVVFRLLMDVKEYGEISYEFRRIVRNTELFGMDIISSIKNVADRTPSTSFRQFLYGIVSTINSGGDLKAFLEGSGKDALFDYRLKREKYLQTLSTYADFYTAVLIAAPLFFVSILSIMSLIGGQVLGLSIPTAMRLGIYVLIPAMNTAFLLFIHYTQPR